MLLAGILCENRNNVVVGEKGNNGEDSYCIGDGMSISDDGSDLDISDCPFVNDDININMEGEGDIGIEDEDDVDFLGLEWHWNK